MNATVIAAVQHITRKPSLNDLLAAQAFGKKLQHTRRAIGLEPFDDAQLKFAEQKYLEVKLEKK